MGEGMKVPFSLLEKLRKRGMGEVIVMDIDAEADEISSGIG